MQINTTPKYAGMFRKKVAPGEYELYETASTRHRNKVLCLVKEVEHGIQLVYDGWSITLPSAHEAMKRAYIIEFGELR